MLKSQWRQVSWLREMDVTALDDGTTGVGKDGKLSWICQVPSQGKMDVMLQWEVLAHVVDTRCIILVLYAVYLNNEMEGARKCVVDVA